MRQVCTRRSRKEGIVKRKGVVFVQRCALHSMSNGLKHFRFGPAGQRSPRLSSLHSQDPAFFSPQEKQMRSRLRWDRSLLLREPSPGKGRDSRGAIDPAEAYPGGGYPGGTSERFGVPSSDTGKYKRGATRAGVGTTMCVPPLRIVFWQSHRSLSVSLRQLHSPDAFPVEARGVNYNAPVF